MGGTWLVVAGITARELPVDVVVHVDWWIREEESWWNLCMEFFRIDELWNTVGVADSS